LILLRNAEVFAPDALGRRDLLLGGGRRSCRSARPSAVTQRHAVEVDRSAMACA
jgi:hypothetical protein